MLRISIFIPKSLSLMKGDIFIHQTLSTLMLVDLSNEPNLLFQIDRC